MENYLLVVSIVEIIYVIYIFNYFKTTIEFNHSFESYFTKRNAYFVHPVGTGNYENKICPLGHLLSYIFAIFIVLRYIINSYFSEEKGIREYIWKINNDNMNKFEHFFFEKKDKILRHISGIITLKFMIDILKDL